MVRELVEHSYDVAATDLVASREDLEAGMLRADLTDYGQALGALDGAEAVRATETGVATAMNTVMRTVGGVIGGEVGAAILTAHLIPGTNVPFARGYEVAFGIAAVAAFVGVFVALLVTPRRERLVVATETSD